MIRTASTALLLLAFATACGDDDRPATERRDLGSTTDAAMADSAVDASAMDDAGDRSDAGPEICEREPLAADRTRFVVLAHPFVPDYEVLELSTDGVVTRRGPRFTMGKAAEARIAFTPDGAVGVAAQDDGSIGIFRLDESGAPTVVERAYRGEFYASGVVMDPSGQSVWIVDSQFRAIGGGLYRLDLDCDGEVTREQLVAPGQLPYGMAFEADGRALVLAKDLLGTSLGPDLHRVDQAMRRVVASTEVFTEADWIGGGFTVGSDHAFSGAAGLSDPNRIAVSTLGLNLATVQTLEVPDPTSILVSPFEDRVLVVSGFGNAIFEYRYAPDAGAPLVATGEVAYAVRGPAIPTIADMVTRGSLEGLVLVSENVAVRTLRFTEGAVTDLGPLELGEGTESIAGAIGIQP